MTDDQELIAEAREYLAGSQHRPTKLVRLLADALSTAAVRNAELQEIFEGGYGEFEESIKDREAKRYRAAIGNWRAAALKAEAELATAAVRYRAEGLSLALDEWSADEHLFHANLRALLDENNETTTMNPRKDGQ